MIDPYETPKRKNDARHPYRRIMIGTILVVIIITLVGLASLRRPASRPTGILYFRSRDVGDPPISALDPQTLTLMFVDWKPPVEDFARGVLSPDGRWNAVWNPKPEFGGDGIIVENRLNGGGGFGLTNPPSGDSLSWSADSRWIGYTALGDTESGKLESWGWIMSADKGETQAVVTDEHVKRLVFAPTGTYLAYVSDGNLWTFDTMTGLKTQVATLYGLDQTIIWSPDGGWLA